MTTVQRVQHGDKIYNYRQDTNLTLTEQVYPAIPRLKRTEETRERLADKPLQARTKASLTRARTEMQSAERTYNSIRNTLDMLASEYMRSGKGKRKLARTRIELGKARKRVDSTRKSYVRAEAKWKSCADTVTPDKLSKALRDKVESEAYQIRCLENGWKPSLKWLSGRYAKALSGMMECHEDELASILFRVSRRVPGKERHDLLQEVALKVLDIREAAKGSTSLVYAAIENLRRDWYRKYKMRQHTSLDVGFKVEDPIYLHSTEDTDEEVDLSIALDNCEYLEETLSSVKFGAITVDFGDNDPDKLAELQARQAQQDARRADVASSNLLIDKTSYYKMIDDQLSYEQYLEAMPKDVKKIVEKVLDHKRVGFEDRKRIVQYLESSPMVLKY